MTNDCLSYPDVGVFTVEIPTSKETEYHKPENKRYNRLLYGRFEGMLHYALKQQIQDTEDDSGDLFDITVCRFNDLLAKICTEHKILDAEGNLAKVTSHNFRHVAITDRLQGNVISAHMAMAESNHSNIEQTMFYGYPSLHDETEHNSKIISDVFEYETISSDGSACVLSLHKYERLQGMPYTRLIPGYGICCEKACTPRYENCFSCEHFYPSKLYKDCVEATIALLDKKLFKLRAENGSTEAIEFNEKQKELYGLFLSRIKEEENELDSKAE